MSNRIIEIKRELSELRKELAGREVDGLVGATNQLIGDGDYHLTDSEIPTCVSLTHISGKSLNIQRCPDEYQQFSSAAIAAILGSEAHVGFLVGRLTFDSNGRPMLQRSFLTTLSGNTDWLELTLTFGHSNGRTVVDFSLIGKDYSVVSGPGETLSFDEFVFSNQNRTFDQLVGDVSYILEQLSSYKFGGKS